MTLAVSADLAEFRYYKSAKFSWLGDEHAGWPTPRTLDSRPPGHEALARDIGSWAIVQSGHGTHMFREDGPGGRAMAAPGGQVNQQAAAADLSEQHEAQLLEVLRAKLRKIEASKARVASDGCWIEVSELNQLEEEEQYQQELEQLPRDASTQKPVRVQKRDEKEKGESKGTKKLDIQKPTIAGSDAYKEWRKIHLNNPGV